MSEETVSGGDPLIAKTIDGRYIVRELLGRGGMGAVYAADHVGLGKRVAIKFVLLDDPDAASRFRREARAASQITHEHVVQVIDVGTDDGRDYLVMEYVPGENLQQRLEAGPIAHDRALAIARQMLTGLDAIHAAGLVHRDIKPGNVMLTSRGDHELVKIMDFGLAKTVTSGDDTVTRAGHIVGTPQYMAPEALAGLDVDQRADLYAVGLVLFVMLTGDADASRRSLAQRDPELPAHVIAAVERALELSPKARFASAREMLDALDGKSAAKQSAETVVERPRAPAPPRERRAWPFAVAGVVAAVGAVVAYVATRSPPAIPASAPAIDHAANARAAENAGKLELAIAEYQEQLAVGGGAEPLFHLGDLSERLGRRTEAGDYFAKYLAAAPDASDHRVVAERLANLRPASVDAGVVAPDAAAVRVRPRAEATAPRKVECGCFATTVRLCSERKPAGDCTCALAGDPNEGLCAGPFQYVDDAERPVPKAEAQHVMCFDPNSRGCERKPDGSRRCPPNWVVSSNATEGASCSGYRDEAKATGIWHCNWCADDMFHGVAGASCSGFSPTTGAPVTGTLGHCFD